jgi:hypothetical protein
VQRLPQVDRIFMIARARAPARPTILEIPRLGALKFAVAMGTRGGIFELVMRALAGPRRRKMLALDAGHHFPPPLPPNQFRVVALPVAAQARIAGTAIVTP